MKRGGEGREREGDGEGFGALSSAAMCLMLFVGPDPRSPHGLFIGDNSLITVIYFEFWYQFLILGP